jgi:hypothetical protein
MSLVPIAAAIVLFIPVLVILGVAMFTAGPMDDHRRPDPPGVPEDEGPWLRLG